MPMINTKLLIGLVFVIIINVANTTTPTRPILGLSQPQFVSDPSTDIYGRYTVFSIGRNTFSQNIDVQITQFVIRVQGCNSLTTNFNYSPATKQYTVGQWLSTKKFCANSQDSDVTNAISAAKITYKRNNGFLVFQNSQGTQTIRLVPITSSSQPVNPVNTGSNQQGFIPGNRPSQINPPNWPYTIPFTQFPELNLPGVSCVALQGTYFFKPTNSDLQTLVITFDDSYLQFEGCNIHRLPYAAFSDGVFVLLQGGSSTLRQCFIDNDSAYIQLLKDVRRYKKTDNGYSLYARRNNLVANLQNKVRNKIVTYGVINGGYQLQIKGIDVYVSPKTIGFFAGCNSISIPYQLDQFNNIVFGSIITTLRFCQQDNDAAYINAITQGVQLRKIREGYVLLDSSGVQTVRFVNYQRQYQSDYNYFSGNYKIQIPNGGIRLKVSDGVFTLEGCNTFTFKFSLADNGTIVFGAVSATNTVCNNDYDKIYLNTILKAQTIAYIDKNIVFFNGNNEQIARALNFDISSNPKKPVIIDNTSPILPTVQFYLQDGNYRFTVVRTSLKPVSLTVNKNRINFRGCNTIGLVYTAASDGTIKFTFRSSTKIFCPDDYDKLYIQALQSAVKYSSTKGIYTFFNDKGRSVASIVSDFGTGAVETVGTGERKPRNTFRQIPQAPISLRGRYKFQLPNPNFQVINGAFVFKGCNTYRLPCAFKNNNIFFGKPISTNNQCGTNDNLLLNLIPLIFNFQRNNNAYTFYDQQNKPILTAAYTSTQQQSNDNSGIISGSYQAQIPNTDVQFDDSNFSFSGCKQNRLGYTAKNTGDISFQVGNQSCQTQYYNAYSNAVQTSQRYRNIDSGFILEDKNGIEKGRCIRN